jgi:hypothetical protein
MPRLEPFDANVRWLVGHDLDEVVRLELRAARLPWTADHYRQLSRRLGIAYRTAQKLQAAWLRGQATGDRGQGDRCPTCGSAITTQHCRACRLRRSLAAGATAGPPRQVDSSSSAEEPL